MAQEAAVPIETVRQLARQIAAEEVAKYARSDPLRNASIPAGGRLIVKHPDGRWLMLMGSYNGSEAKFLMPDGSQQPMALIWRADGTLAFGMYDPDPSNGFQQFWSLWDRQGNIVVSDDTNSGQGIARPYLPAAFYPARDADFPKTAATSFETVWRAYVDKQQPRLFVSAWGTTDTAGTTGEVRVMVNNVQLGATQAAGNASVNGYNFGPAAVAGAFGETLAVEIQARRTAGTGSVQVGAAWVEGRQS